MAEMNVLPNEQEAGPVERLNLWWAQQAFRRNTQEFYRQLSGALRGGKSTRDTIRDMETRARLRGDPRALVHAAIGKQLANGLPFYQSMEGHVSQIDVSLLTPSVSDTKAFLRSLDIAEKVAGLRIRLQRASGSKLLGPLMTFFSVTSMAVFMGGTIFPEIVANGDNKSRTGTIFTMIDASTFVLNHWVQILAAVGLYFALSFFLRSRVPNSRLRRWLDYLPPWGFYRVQAGANTVIALSALIETGTSANESFGMLAQSAGGYLRSHLHEMKEQLNRGVPLANALDTGLFPKALLDEIAIRGRPDNIQDVLRQLGLERMEELEFLILKTIAVWANAFQIAAYGIGIFTAMAFLGVYDLASSSAMG